MWRPRSHMYPCKHGGKQVTQPYSSFQVRVVLQLAEYRASRRLSAEVISVYRHSHVRILLSPFITKNVLNQNKIKRECHCGAVTNECLRLAPTAVWWLVDLVGRARQQPSKGTAVFIFMCKKTLFQEVPKT